MQLGIAIITAFVNIGLVLVVLAKNSRSWTNRTFAGLIFVNSLYPIFNYLSLNATEPETAFTWAKLAIATGISTGPLYYLFVHTFPAGRLSVSPWIVWGLLGWWLLNIALLATNNLFKSVTIVDGQPVLEIGPAIPLFGLMMLLTLGGGSVFLFRKYLREKGLARLQLQVVMFGLFAGFGLTLLSTIILPVTLGFTSLIPFSSLFLLLTGVTISYAILRHRLFDIRRVVARAATYILLFVTISTLYVASVFALTVVFFGSSSLLVRHIMYVVMAVFIAFTFKYIERFFQRVTDRIFYRERYDTEQVLSGFSKVLVSELDIDCLLKRSLTYLTQSLHISYGQIVVFNHDKVYKMEHVGSLPHRLIIGTELRRLNHPMLVADELPEGERKRILDAHSLRLSCMLRTKEGVIGYLLLGDKLSGDIYSSQDVKLLEIASRELAVSLQNAKAYAEIQAFNATLQERVNHATARLREANAHLKELDRAKDEFISMASHQLRTPLTTIKGYLSMILEGDAGTVTPVQKEFLEYAFAGSERMVNLISDLLNVSRLSAGRFIIQAKPTDVLAMAQDEVRQLQSHAAAKNLELKLEAPSEMPIAEIDENKTRQVVMNFIDNAIYYTAQGSVTVSLMPGRESFRLEVRDTGMGVPKAAQKKLFTKFFRAENAQGVRPDGTGLGLYLAKRVVEDQGGTIIFESVEGHGSVFGFELPYVSAVTQKADHAKPRIHA